MKPTAPSHSFDAFSPRTRKILRKHRIYSVSDLARYSDRELLSLRGIGLHTFAEIRAGASPEGKRRLVVCPVCSGQGRIPREQAEALDARGEDDGTDARA